MLHFVRCGLISVAIAYFFAPVPGLATNSSDCTGQTPTSCLLKKIRLSNGTAASHPITAPVARYTRRNPGSPESGCFETGTNKAYFMCGGAGASWEHSIECEGDFDDNAMRAFGGWVFVIGYRPAIRVRGIRAGLGPPSGGVERTVVASRPARPQTTVDSQGGLAVLVTQTSFGEPTRIKVYYMDGPATGPLHITVSGGTGVNHDPGDGSGYYECDVSKMVPTVGSFVKQDGTGWTQADTTVVANISQYWHDIDPRTP